MRERDPHVSDFVFLIGDWEEENNVLSFLLLSGDSY